MSSLQNATLAVVIPTYNRHQSLESVLSALIDQDRVPDEVVVVDDGSTDSTWDFLCHWSQRDELPYNFLIYRQDNAGAASARNVGVRRSCSDIIAFLGDDTIPAGDWAAQHLRKHAELGAGYAVVGYTGWDEESVRVTPFLRYINSCGAQFKYGSMRDGEEVPYYCLYTSNLSMPRGLLERDAFDEDFRGAGWEDAELGYRLVNGGTRVVYSAAARTRHAHPTTMLSFMRRQYNVGCACHVLARKYPELGLRMHCRRTVLAWVFVVAGYCGIPLLPLFNKLDNLMVRLPRTVYLFYLSWYYLRGVLSVKTGGRGGE